MTEDFLHFVWKFQRFHSHDLHTTQGQGVSVLAPGLSNTDGGPDFSHARVKIGDTTWAGHVEMHVRSSDWMKHGHHRDRAYDNVILHVVFEDDIPLRKGNSEPMPTLELKGQIEPLIFHKYSALLTNRDWIPCQGHIASVDPMVVRSCLDRMAIERIEEKTHLIEEELAAAGNSWEDVFYRRLARHFGMKVNDEAFEMLAESLPLKVLAKHKNNLLQIEAMLFGQAGMLEELFGDEYPRSLQKEYDHLRKLHDLHPMQGHVWQFLRMRPANFPSIRLAQLAALIQQSTHLLSRVLEIDSLKKLRELFACKPSAYWKDHYQFDKVSAAKSKTLGDAAIDNILINVIAPVLFVYGSQHGKPALKERALELLGGLSPESNHIVRKWAELEVKAESALDSQALLHLKRSYCSAKRCLECTIGNTILKSDVKKSVTPA